VVAERAHERGARARARGRDGLVEALAAGPARVFARERGARRGQRLAAPDVVDVERADDDDVHAAGLHSPGPPRAARAQGLPTSAAPCAGTVVPRSWRCLNSG